MNASAPAAATGRFVEVGFFDTDPVPWLLDSPEPYARWAALDALVHGSPEQTADTHAAVLADSAVAALIAGLPGWGDKDFPGHNSPQFLPNQLNLLADMGVGGGDCARVEMLLDAMLDHTSEDGRFLAFGRAPTQPEPRWGSMPCDINAIADVLLRFGRGEDPRVEHAVARIVDDAETTPQGLAWRCVTGAGETFRGPGRSADACPQATLEALRALSHLDPAEQPACTLEMARTPLEIWRRRATEHPYMFGHGYQFKSVKWPNFWYDVLWVLETVGRYPELRRGAQARDEDRRAIAEMAACLIAYNFDRDGLVTPRRTYKGFEAFSFGQKKLPSAFATARTLIALARLSDIAEEIAAVDVLALPSSRGGSGTVRPPKTARG